MSSKPADRVYQQDGSNGYHCTRRLFNGKKASSQHPHRSHVADHYNEGKILEDAFWQRRPLQGRNITSTEVLSTYRNDCSSLRAGFFLQKLCLKNRPYNGVKITPNQVIEEFNRAPARNNKCQLAKVRFKAECCLRCLLLNGQQVTPDAVVNDYRAASAPLELARFQEQCCLRGLLLNGQPVTPDAVVNDFPETAEGKLGIARFKAECCLRGLLLNGQPVTPDAVLDDFKQGHWLLERAIFLSHLALNSKKLDANYLNNHQVFVAFRKVPGDHSSRQVDYLIQRLKTLPGQDETDDTLETLKQAWQIVNNVPVKDEENRHQQCIIRFMAMEYGFPVDHQRLSAQQVLPTINDLRSSFQNTHLHFLFLAHYYLTNQSLDGQQVQKHQVLDCLQGLPERSKLRHALGCWLEERSAEANLVNQSVFRRGNPVVIRGEGDSQLECTASVWQPERGNHLPDVIPVTGRSGQRVEKVEVFMPNLAGYYPEQQPGTAAGNAPLAVAADAAQVLKQCLNTGKPTASDRRVPLLNPLTNRSLEIIQEVNGIYTAPVILITGSFARYLQGIGTSFNDIDIICTTEEAASILIDRLISLNTDMDSAVHKKVVVWPIPGCPEIRLPVAYNIRLIEGDLGTNTMLQVRIDSRVPPGNKDVATVHLPGVERPVRCLSFIAEVWLINDTLEFLTDQLYPLTEQLQKGAELNIPRTILFNFPRSSEERIYGLLMRCLLTLNKAKQFHSLLAEGGKTGYWPEHATTTLYSTTLYSTTLYSTTLYSTTLYFKTFCRLQHLTENLHARLKSHTCRDHFARTLEAWISENPHNNDCEKKKCQFIKSLLEMVTIE